LMRVMVPAVMLVTPRPSCVEVTSKDVPAPPPTKPSKPEYVAVTDDVSLVKSILPLPELLRSVPLPDMSTARLASKVICGPVAEVASMRPLLTTVRAPGTLSTAKVAPEIVLPVLFVRLMLPDTVLIDRSPVVVIEPSLRTVSVAALLICIPPAPDVIVPSLFRLPVATDIEPETADAVLPILRVPALPVARLSEPVPVLPDPRVSLAPPTRLSVPESPFREMFSRVTDEPADDAEAVLTARVPVVIRTV